MFLWGLRGPESMNSSLSLLPIVGGKHVVNYYRSLSEVGFLVKILIFFSNDVLLTLTVDDSGMRCYF